MTQFLRLYLNPRIAAVLALGFASGLPLALTGDTLQAWMAADGMGVREIGRLSLVGLPYAFKFLWAPLMDRFALPLLGRRRGWLALMQLLLVVAIIALGQVGPMRHLWLTAVVATIVAFFSASQDIVCDAYRTDILSPEQRGAGAAAHVTAYRIAMIVSYPLALILCDTYGWSWSQIYTVMAGCMGVGIIATLLAPEPASPGVPATLKQAVAEPLKELLLRPGIVWVLLLILCFKLPDTLAGGMVQKFLVDAHVSLTAIGTARKLFGLLATIAGATAGGAAVARIGLYRSLWMFGALQAISNVGFCVMAWQGPWYPTMLAAIVIESFCVGMATAGFVAFLMGHCNPRYSATQFALLSGVMAFGRYAGGAPAGYVAAWLGWTNFFLLSILAGVPGVVLVLVLKPGQKAEAVQVESEKPIPVAQAA